jgi:hypothetical protein
MMSYRLKKTFLYESHVRSFPLVAQSEACFCGRSLSGIVGSNLAEGVDVFSLVSFVCCQVEVSATS